MKRKIVIFGTGKGRVILEQYLNPENAEIVGYLDNNREKQGGKIDGKPIFLPEKIKNIVYDYIFLSIVGSSTVQMQLENLGIEKEKIAAFFDGTNETDASVDNLLTGDWKYAFLSQYYQVKMERLEKKFGVRMENVPYELADKLRTNSVILPIVRSGEEAIEKIIKENCSISRFGDFEFEMMLGRVRCNYQRLNEKLSERLREVLHSRQSNLLVAIADNYGSLDKYTADAGDAIRKYLSGAVRNEHMSLLEADRTYYDAYLSRPYIIYEDKENAGKRFAHLMKIWEDRDVVLIEGNKTRMGVGNNLFSGARSVRRIIAPNENAFDKYSNILSEACKQSPQALFLLSLGPTATILAYDLARKGYQAIDIGQIDNEYEWFLRGVKSRVTIPDKYVNEVSGGDMVEGVETCPIDGIIAYIA